MHSATLSILIGVLALIAAGGFIIKGYNAKGVLFAIGIALLVVALALGNDIAHPHPNPPPGPMQNADAFCMGTRPLRASPCRRGECLKLSTRP